MVKILQQLWRLVRVGGEGAAAATVSSTVHGLAQGGKVGIVAGIVAVAEVAYRQLVPAKETSKLATFVTRLCSAYDQVAADAEKGVADVKADAAPAAAAVAHVETVVHAVETAVEPTPAATQPATAPEVTQAH